jgi:hypothetical protein
MRGSLQSGGADMRVASATTVETNIPSPQGPSDFQLLL